ncbi:MAG: zinc ribbon domain-containing protein [Dehalococcoidia bacterium]|jgi:putative FmdB family regulatory protein
MPTYEYECGNCRYRFDLKQGFHDEPEAICPECEQKARRVFHPAPVIYKTSGFYITDSRKKNTPEPSKKDSQKSESSSSTGSTSGSSSGSGSEGK